MNFRLIPLRVPEKMILDRQMDGHQSDSIRVAFLPLQVRNPKNLSHIVSVKSVVIVLLVYLNVYDDSLFRIFYDRKVIGTLWTMLIMFIQQIILTNFSDTITV